MHITGSGKQPVLGLSCFVLNVADMSASFAPRALQAVRLSVRPGRRQQLELPHRDDETDLGLEMARGAGLHAWQIDPSAFPAFERVSSRCCCE